MTHSTLIHLRFPFSYFLLPIFLFSVAAGATPDLSRAILIFTLLHLFLYPASNGYNSWHDRDDSSIGGIEIPPTIDKSLIVWVTILDLLTLIIAWTIGFWFFIFATFYTIASKLYSNSKTRLKRYPLLGWFLVAFGQGACTFLGIQFGLHPGLTPIHILTPDLFIPAILITLFLAATYPMTQVYQHEADKKRGDTSFSMLLGIRGTFILALALYPLIAIGFFFYYKTFAWIGYGHLYFLFQIPGLVYFVIWFFCVLKDPAKANFRSTMRLNLITSTCLNLFFSTVFIMEHIL